MIIHDNIYKFTNIILLGSFIFYVLFFRYFGDVKIAVILMSVWIVIAFTYIQKNISIRNYFKKNFIHKFNNKLSFSILKSTIPHILFISYIILFAYEISKTPGMPISQLMNILSVVFIFCSLSIQYLNKDFKKISVSTIAEYSIYYIIFLGILTGHGVRDSIQSHIIFYSFIGATSSYFFISKNIRLNKFKFGFDKEISFVSNHIINFSKKEYFYYVFLLFSFCFFSVRTDILGYGSAVFHWAYFTAPTYEVNFQNFFSTLSQYSLAFNILASKISPNPHFSVWLAQVILLNIVFFMGIFVCRKFRYRSIIIISFAILVLFVDPSSVGPQAYPSSSVVRFFPFYMMVLSYVAMSSYQKSIISKVIFILSIIASLLWSSLTSLSLITAIILFIGLRLIINFLNYHNFKERFEHSYKEMKYHFLALLVIILIIITLGINTYIYDHQFYYVSTRYGWQSSGSIWVTAPLLFITVMIFRHILNNKNPYSFLLAMPVIASFAYYSYRPLSHNLLAILPLLFFTLIAMQYGEEKSKKLSFDKKVLDSRLLKNITISIIIFGVISFLFQIPNKNTTPFSIVNITENNIKGLSNNFFSILDPSEVCRQNEIRYQEFLSSFYDRFSKAEKKNIPFVILADFLEVSHFGSCFINKKDKLVQRRIFYSSPLYNAPLPTSYSKILITNYLKRHQVEEFFVIASSRNIYSKKVFDSFTTQLPKEYKMQKDNFPIIGSQYFDGVKNVDISLELVYFGPRDFK